MSANKTAGIQFLFGIAGLLLFQLFGEITVRYLDIPVPGPIAGMLLLLIILLIYSQFKSVPPASLDQSSSTLLNHLSLLFVPAGVGVIVHFDKILLEWRPILVALIAGVLITIVATAFTMQALVHLLRIEIDKRQDQKSG